VREGEIVLEDGDTKPLGGLLVPVTLHQRTDIALQLGATIAEPGMLAVDAVQTDAMAHTSVPGLYAAGDVTGDMPSMPIAIAAGLKAAASIVHDLL
jgi:thioredoxin reductase